MKFLGIIPARYSSSRFPGKPLAQLGGKPVIQHVYERAKQVLTDVYVATDDERIYNVVTAFGGKAVMTQANHWIRLKVSLMLLSIFRATNLLFKRSKSE